MPFKVTFFTYFISFELQHRKGGAVLLQFSQWGNWYSIMGWVKSKKWKSLSRVRLFEPARFLCPWNSPGRNTGVGSLSLLQGISPTQGSNPSLPHCRWILYQLSHKGSPRILGWVAYPFSRGSSQPRNRTRVSCIVGDFFINWAIREAQGASN